MTDVNEVELLPDPDQHDVLTATLERVNRASNAARAAARQQNVFEGAALREIVKEEVARAKLPDGFTRAITERVEAALRRRTGKQAKFSNFQSLTMPASAYKWGGSDRVTMLTASGRRTISVRVDRSRGDLRPPLANRPAALVYRNGEFELWAMDVNRAADED
ncbi:MAG TPA: hypothetical protein VFR41_12485 [Acidimicrobiia bacterium]|nr:hypothetical protein [Acidimicrobiia bacterium]